MKQKQSDKILILGDGGHSLGIQEALLDIGFKTEQLGIVDLTDHEESIFGIRVIGKDEDLPDLAAHGWKKAVIGVGSVENTGIRHQLTDKLENAGIELMTVAAPGALVSRQTRLGQGVYVAKGAIIQPDTEIGEMAIINTGAVIEHNCQVGAYSHVSSGAVLTGNVTIGHDSFIGAGSVVRHGIRIGDKCVIGAGSTVVKDIPDDCVAYGNPCRIRKGDREE